MPGEMPDIRELLDKRTASVARSPAQLSATDTSFLMQERDGAQMHIGGVSLFKGPAPEHEELREHIWERLGLVPRFRQRLSEPPVALTRPWWVDDPEFNLDYHLRRTALPWPGGDDQLKALVARIFSQRLDRGKPLWEMYLVEGLQDERFALITKVHHALVDGISGVDLASVIMDTKREPAPLGGAAVPFERHPAPSRAELLARTVVEAAKTPLSLAHYAAGGVLYPQRLTRAATTVAAAAGAMAWELLNAAPSVPLNGPIGPHRRFETRELRLSDIREVKQRYEATVNDVVLAISTGALRRWLIARGVRTDGLELRALVPVNVRADEERGLLGNRVALLRAALPVYAEDPEQRLLLVRDAMRRAKRSRQLMAAQTIIGLSDFALPTILAQASRMNFSTRLFNLIITNVPGPQLPLYLLGRELEAVVPVAFLPRRHALSIAVFSYNGLISVGLLGDHDRMYDLELIGEGVEESLAELEQPAVAMGADGDRGPLRPAPSREPSRES